MMKRTSLALFTLFIAACSSGSGGDDDDIATTPTPVPTPAPNETPTFAVHIKPLIEASCGTTNNACHSRVAYGANPSTVGGACRGWLSLEDADLGSEIYGGPNAGDPTGCPDRSLFDRLTAAGLSNAWQCGPNVFDPGNPDPTVAYVVAGDAAASYMYRKINGGPYCGTPSDPMPQGAPLPAATIDIFRRWIDGGALP